MRNLRWMTAAAAMALLSACGGGGGDSGGGGTVVTPGPTPTPTPTPVAYVRSDDFSKDLTSDGIGATLSALRGDGRVDQITTAFELNPAQVGFRYQASAKLYDLAYGGERLNQVKAVFSDDNDSFPVDNSGRVYGRDPDRYYEFSRSVWYQTKYVSTFSWSSSVVQASGEDLRTYRYAIAGSSTVARDLPTSGAYDFYSTATSVGESSDYTTLNVFSQAASVDWASGVVSGNLIVSGASGVEEKLAFTAKLDRATGRFSGRVDHARFPGEVEGLFYGPEAREIGAVFRFGDATSKAVGLLVGVEE